MTTMLCVARFKGISYVCAGNLFTMLYSLCGLWFRGLDTHKCWSCYRYTLASTEPLLWDNVRRYYFRQNGKEVLPRVVQYRGGDEDAPGRYPRFHGYICVLKLKLVKQVKKARHMLRHCITRKNENRNVIIGVNVHNTYMNLSII